MKTLLLALASVAALFAVPSLDAQNYSINWYTVSGGGGTSAGADGTNSYSVTGTIGQPATATMAGGAYSLTGGFWSFLAAVQTPGSPMLTIARSGKQAVISWNASAGGFALQQTSTLATNAWSLSSALLTTNGSTISASVSITNGGYQYFRLIAQ